jgi:hypothetical protein
MADIGGPMSEIDIGQGRAERNPLATTWTHPRRAFRDMLATRPTHLVLPLAAAWGMYRSLALQITRGAGDYMAIPMMLLMSAILGTMAGIALVGIFGWIWAWTGRLLGGQATPQALRAAIAWGQAPVLFLLALTVVQFAAIGPELFHKSKPSLAGNDGLKQFYFATLLCRRLLDGWIIARMIILTARAHRFSVWRAMGTLVLGLAPGFAVILAFVALVMMA